MADAWESISATPRIYTLHLLRHDGHLTYRLVGDLRCLVHDSPRVAHRDIALWYLGDGLLGHALLRGKAVTQLNSQKRGDESFGAATGAASTMAMTT